MPLASHNLLDSSVPASHLVPRLLRAVSIARTQWRLLGHCQESVRKRCMAERVASILKRNVAEIRSWAKSVAPRSQEDGIIPFSQRSRSDRSPEFQPMRVCQASDENMEALAVVVLLVTSGLDGVRVVDGMSSLQLWRGDNRQSRQERSSQWGRSHTHSLSESLLLRKVCSVWRFVMAKSAFSGCNKTPKSIPLIVERIACGPFT